MSVCERLRGTRQHGVRACLHACVDLRQCAGSTANIYVHARACVCVCDMYMCAKIYARRRAAEKICADSALPIGVEAAICTPACVCAICVHVSVTSGEQRGRDPSIQSYRLGQRQQYVHVCVCMYNACTNICTRQLAARKITACSAPRIGAETAMCTRMCVCIQYVYTCMYQAASSGKDVRPFSTTDWSRDGNKKHVCVCA